MPAAVPKNVFDLLHEHIPNLIVGTGHTHSSTIRPITFVGELGTWLFFKFEVQQTTNSIRPPPGGYTTIDYDPINIHASTLLQEQFQVGNEHGVQGRFNDRIGHTMNIIAKILQENFMFGDFQAAQKKYIKTPDGIIITMTGTLIVVIETKAPWVQAHQLKPKLKFAQEGQEEDLQESLGKFNKMEQRLKCANILPGQVAEYMNDLNLKYGVLTTYDETIFLRQKVFQRKCILECSPVISNNAVYIQEFDSVTLRQCFLHVAMLASEDWQFDRSGIRSAWTERRRA